MYQKWWLKKRNVEHSQTHCKDSEASNQLLLMHSIPKSQIQTYNQRLRIINTIPALRRYGRLIETLGIEGTSSDKEGPRHGVYSVKRKPQLSSNVEGLKRQLDQAFYIHFKGPGTKGNQVRHRKDEGLISKRKFHVKGLPLSCMDPVRLATQTDIQKEMLDFIDHDYDFPFQLNCWKRRDFGNMAICLFAPVPPCVVPIIKLLSN
ncbi:hypothetical protein FRC12_006954 [Ceratobasidium sp. 428]|nr:hypothetical protein FRC12_006954 [Ceratobasidium sp. 428]